MSPVAVGVCLAGLQIVLRFEDNVTGTEEVIVGIESESQRIAGIDRRPLRHDHHLLAGGGALGPDGGRETAVDRSVAVGIDVVLAVELGGRIGHARHTQRSTGGSAARHVEPLLGAVLNHVGSLCIVQGIDGTRALIRCADLRGRQWPIIETHLVHVTHILACGRVGGAGKRADREVSTGTRRAVGVTDGRTGGAQRTVDVNLVIVGVAYMDNMRPIGAAS